MIAARAAAVEAITQVPRDVLAAAGMTEEPVAAVAAAIAEVPQDTAAAVVETAAAVAAIMVVAATAETIKETLPATGDSGGKRSS